MNQEVKKIELPEGITTFVSQVVKEIKELNSQVELKNSRISDMLTGFALSHGVDLSKEGLVFTDDFKAVILKPLPQAEPSQKSEDVVSPTKKAKVKPIKG